MSLSAKLWPFFLVILVALAMPSVGSSSAQSNNSSTSGNTTDPAVGGNNDNTTTTDDRVNNTTNRGGDVTDNNKNVDDLPIVNDTETSSADEDANIVINE